MTPLPELQSAFRRVGPWRLHERHRTDLAGGTPVVLVHGLGVSSRYLVPVARALAPHRPVYAPDLPGWGRSDRPRAVLGIPALAAALAAWLDEAGIERACLLANSLGCQTVAELAATEPGRVEAVVLVGPTFDPQARSFPRQLARLVATAPSEPLALDALVAFEYLSEPVRTVRTALLGLQHRIEERLPLVQAPALVVRGTGDRICPPRWAREAAALLPDGRLETLAGGHALNFGAPGPLARLTLDLLG